MAGAGRGSYRQGTGGADDMNRHYVRTIVGLEIVDFNIAATDALQAQYDRPISVYLDSHGSFGFGGATERLQINTSDAIADSYLSDLNARLTETVGDLGTISEIGRAHV